MLLFLEVPNYYSITVYVIAVRYSNVAKYNLNRSQKSNVSVYSSLIEVMSYALTDASAPNKEEILI